MHEVVHQEVRRLGRQRTLFPRRPRRGKRVRVRWAHNEVGEGPSRAPHRRRPLAAFFVTTCFVAAVHGPNRRIRRSLRLRNGGFRGDYRVFDRATRWVGPDYVARALQTVGPVLATRLGPSQCVVWGRTTRLGTAQRVGRFRTARHGSPQRVAWVRTARLGTAQTVVWVRTTRLGLAQTVVRVRTTRLASAQRVVSVPTTVSACGRTNFGRWGGRRARKTARSGGFGQVSGGFGWLRAASGGVRWGRAGVDCVHRGRKSVVRGAGVAAAVPAVSPLGAVVPTVVPAVGITVPIGLIPGQALGF